MLLFPFIPGGGPFMGDLKRFYETVTRDLLTS